MVVAIREQQPKKSKLSLFRLGKASTKPTAQSPPNSNSHQHGNTTDLPYPDRGSCSSDQDSTPRQLPRGVNSLPSRNPQKARQAAREDDPIVVPVHVQFPQSADLSLNYDWASSSEDRDSPHDDAKQHRRARADSVSRRKHDGPTASSEQMTRPRGPTPPQIHIDTSSAWKHSRQRSHFSIPDVIVTGCEEEGEEEIVEVQIPPNKRRSYVLSEPTEERGRESRVAKKSSSGFIRRPAPLISFGSDEMRSMRMARSGSDPSISSNSTVSPTESVASSSLSKGSSAKRSRKPSFPNLFGRKSLDSARTSGAGQAYTVEPLPISPTTPTSAPIIGGDSYRSGQPDGLLFSSHTPSPSRPTFSRSASGLPSPPVTPTSPTPRVASKKELKAKAKEELALLKKLQHADKLVKQHDTKARKAQEKAEIKERKRAAKLALVNEEFHRPSMELRSSFEGFDSGPYPPMPARTGRQTVFQASTKASSGVARRTSIRNAAEVRSLAGERRGSEPTVPISSGPTGPRGIVGPKSMDLPDSERLDFTQPRPAPRPNLPSSSPQQSHIHPNLPRESSPPRPTRPAPPIPASSALASNEAAAGDEGEISLSEDADTQAWDRMNWSDFSSGLGGPLPSLLPSSCSSTVGVSKRSSVPRLPADGASLSKRVSLKQGRDGESASRRSSKASVRRRSFIRTLSADEGWHVVTADEDELAGVDDSIVAQPDLSLTRWDDWIESEKSAEDEVDVVLADLCAQQTRIKGVSPPRPTRSAARTRGAGGGGQSCPARR